jgi:two-component sensor histidine kinase
LLDAIDQGFCLIEVLFDECGRAVDYRFLEVNAAFAAQTGLVEAVGRTMRSLRPEHEEHWFEIYGRVARTGEATRFENPALALGRWYDVYAFRVGAPEQRMVAVLFSDITERKRTEDRLALATAEIDHRANNLLTLAMSMARVTRADTVAEFRAKLLGRLAALSRSQRFLSEQNRNAADLDTLVAEEMAGHVAASERRASWAGPPVTIGPAQAQCIAMTLHELATNATKYGALSMPGGRVALAWHVDDGRVALRWTETGGPPITAAPDRQGTGTRVMNRCVADQLNGKIAFDWRREGLVCDLSFPLPPAQAT